jgi:hypothetical protein
MTAAAPNVRIVNALNGKITAPPTKFMQALSEADSFCAELDETHRLRDRCVELEIRVNELTEELSIWRDEALAARAKAGAK